MKRVMWAVTPLAGIIMLWTKSTALLSSVRYVLIWSTTSLAPKRAVWTMALGDFGGAHDETFHVLDFWASCVDCGHLLLDCGKSCYG